MVAAEAGDFGMQVELIEGMSELPMEQPMSLRDTAKGIAVRAGLLSAGILLVSVWIFSLLLKVAGASMRALLGVLMLLIAGGVIAFEVKKVQRRLTA
jgi:hypothetical protein